MADSIDVALSVDALSPQLTGIGRYNLALVRRLPRMTGIGSVNYFRGPHWLHDPEALLSAEWQPARKGKWKRRFENWQRKRSLRDAIVHGPNYFLPDWAESGVITVHDLSVLRYPETHPVERVLDFERRFQRSLDRAAVVLTDCEAVRSEIVEMLGIPADRIHAVPLGVDPPHAIGEDSGAELASLGLTPKAFTFCLSTFEPRKRIDRLVEAYAELDPKLRERIPLVLAGASGWQNEDLNEKLGKAVAEGWLKRMEFVPDSVRDLLFREARLFVYPSRYEGFGLPPIEAMKHGTPTLVGNAAALVEVTKGAAREVDPDEVTAFSLAIADALEDETWQATAGEQGRAVADGYSWQDCVSKTVEAYRSLASCR